MTWFIILFAMITIRIIGNTKRKLETRVKEHKSALNKPYVHSNFEHSFKTT